MDATLKILLVGQSGSGKTCFVKRYSSDTFDASQSNSLPAPTIGFDASSKIIRGLDIENGSLSGGENKVKVFFLDTSGEADAETQRLAYGPSLASGVANSTTPSALVVFLVVDVDHINQNVTLSTASSSAEAVAEHVSKVYVAPLLNQLATVSEDSIRVGAVCGPSTKGSPSFVLVGAKCDTLAAAGSGEGSLKVLRDALATVVAKHSLTEFVLTSSAAGCSLPDVETARSIVDRIVVRESKKAKNVWSAAKESTEATGVIAPVSEQAKEPTQGVKKDVASKEDFPMWNVGEEEMRAQFKAFEEASAKATTEAEHTRVRRAAMKRGLLVAASILSVVGIAAMISRRTKASRK